MKNITSLLLIFVIGGICLRIHGGDSYDFFMISDTHFGTAERFCTDPKAPRHHRTRKDIHRADKAMPHYKALFSHIARSAGAGTKFLIEGGDLIEGCTVSEAAHGQELADAVSFITRPRIWCRSDRPKFCAEHTMMVLALGMSMPLSMMVVEMSTS